MNVTVLNTKERHAKKRSFKTDDEKRVLNIKFRRAQNYDKARLGERIIEDAEELMATRQTESVKDQFFGKKKGKAYRAKVAEQDEQLTDMLGCKDINYAKQVQAKADQLVAQQEEERRKAEEEAVKKEKERTKFPNRRIN